MNIKRYDRLIVLIVLVILACTLMLVSTFSISVMGDYLNNVHYHHDEINRVTDFDVTFK